MIDLPGHGASAPLTESEVVLRLAARIGVADQLDVLALALAVDEALGQLVEHAGSLLADRGRVEVELGLAQVAELHDSRIDRHRALGVGLAFAVLVACAVIDGGS